MDIYEFAMQMEKDGEKFYRDLAAKCGDKGLANILTMMADTEVEHYEMFKKMGENIDPTLSETPLLNDVKNVFETMKETQGEVKPDTAQVDLYKQAQAVEKKSAAFYLEKAAEVKSIPHKKIFEQIAASEEEHYHLLGKLIEFVNSPSEWLENAEWHHLGEY